MDTTTILVLAIIGVELIIFFILIAKVERQLKESRMETLQYMQNSFKNFGTMISDNQKESAINQDKQLEMMNQQLYRYILDSEKKLDQMRSTVEEKLEKTLEDRITQSFQLVNERLQQVYEGLGEMKNLANQVGDVKKVLSGVKTRGILGEVQLGAILEQILTKDQYACEVATVPGSQNRVEFAVRLPGQSKDQQVWLPIDSKFPGETYSKLLDAYEIGDKVLINEAYKNLERVIKQEAKDIKDKYLAPPYTTDFAIMFLPFEGLYAEVIRHGLLEVLQRDYKVNIAGPTTMAALLNSLQMGFKTLAIEKHSSQVWEILGAVKTEFGNFERVLNQTRNRLRQADTDLENLIGTRTRAIERKLRSVEALEETEAKNVLTSGTFTKGLEE